LLCCEKSQGGDFSYRNRNYGEGHAALSAALFSLENTTREVEVIPVIKADCHEVTQEEARSNHAIPCSLFPIL